MHRIFLGFATLVYAVFLGAFLYAIGFVGNVVVPKSIDQPDGVGGWTAVAIDAAVLALFAIQHSVMARPAFKRWWTRIVPPPIERSVYVLVSSLLLILVFVAWMPLTDIVWDVGNEVAAAALSTLFVVGWLIVLASTFMISHFELFGLTQAWRALRARPTPESAFTVTLLYRFVRHPLMSGFVVAFWATPTMTQGHLLFALLTTGYILVGIHLEERDLIAVFGATYARYRGAVPMLVPFIGRRAGPVVAAPDDDVRDHR